MGEENTTREFWIQEPGRGALVEGRLPELERGQLRVRSLYSGISRGTESLVFRGEVPPSQHEAMRCPFQEGEFPAPVKYGYMSVGRVEAAGEGFEADGGVADDGGLDPSRLVGQAVYCLHPHQDVYVVPVGAVTPLPEGLPPERAVLGANMETAVNTVWDAAPTVGDRIVVFGAGVVGTLVAWLARAIPGTDVTLVDPNPAREEVAAALSIPFSLHPPDETSADLVVNASGSPDALRSALATAGTESTVVEASWYGTRSVELPLGERFHAQRITLRSSQVGGIPPDRAPRWSYRRRMALALELLLDSALDVLLTGESPFSELPERMERLARGGDDTLCHRIRY